MGKIFLDANILLELLLLRAKTKLVTSEMENRNGRFCISPLSVHLCYHYCLQEGILAERIKDFLQDFEILIMDDRTVELAQNRFTGKDFEDCLQAVCAELGKCDEILTLDKDFRKNSHTKLKVTVI